MGSFPPPSSQPARWIGWILAAGLIVLLWLAGVAGVAWYVGHRAAARAARTAPGPTEIHRIYTATAPVIDPTDARAFEDAINAAGNALRRGNGSKVLAALDLGQMEQALAEEGCFTGLSRADRRGFMNGVESGLRASKPQSFLEWTRLEIRSVTRRSADDVVVFTKLQLANGASSRMAWFLYRRGGTWRLYDFQDLEGGFRWTTLMAVAGAAARGGTVPKWASALHDFPAIRRAIDNGDFAQADQLLTESEKTPLPPRIDALRLLLRAAVSTNLGHYPRALAACAEAQRLNPEMAGLDFLRAAAYYHSGEPERCLAACRRFQAALGPDSLVCEFAGCALLQLQRPAEAAVEFRTALRENSESAMCLAGLAIVVSKDGQAELASLLRLSRDRDVLFRGAAAELLSRNEMAALEALLAAYAPAKRADPYFLYYTAQIHAGRKEYAAAADILAGLLANPPADCRDTFAEEYVRIAGYVRPALEVYEKAPNADYAFQHLANQVRYQQQDAATLEALIARHAVRSPKDLQLHWARADFCDLRKDLAGVERACAAGMQAAPDEAQTRRFRYRRVTARCRLGDALGAYRDIGPKDAVFAQLAFHLSGQRSADVLAQLLALRQADAAGDPALHYWQAEIHYLRAEYDRCVSLLREHAAALAEHEDLSFQYNDRLIRSLVRLHRHSDALREAQRYAGKETATWHLLIVHAALGHTSEVQDLIAALKREDEDFDPEYLYDDEDLGPALRGAALEPLRKLYPPPAPATAPATQPLPPG